MTHIGIIGAGSWGTALAQCLANADRKVTLWAREPSVVDAINTQHKNPNYLPEIDLNPSLRATESLAEAAKADVILLVTPAQFVRSILESLKGEIVKGKPIVICSKGVEISSGQLMSQVAEQEVPGATIAILTGPTFASEVARGLPCAMTVAADNKDVGQAIREAIGNRVLRPYVTDDVLGAQIGGAVKNVVAIACGVVMGRGRGENARAALLTRGLAEMARLSKAMGAREETLMGMCGVGDLMLTCSSMQSRNYSLGFEIGQGKTIDDILNERKGKAVTEGVHTAKALNVLARHHAVDMPVAEIVHRVLGDGMPVDEAIETMLERPLRPATM